MKKGLELLAGVQRKLLQAFRPSELILEFIFKMCFLNEGFCRVFSEEKAIASYFVNWLKCFKNVRDMILREKSTMRVFAKKPQPNLKPLESICRVSLPFNSFSFVL